MGAEDRQRYLVAAHAMQSGVAMELELGSNSATPKMLRTGVNAAMVDSSALALLLVEKGVITLDEYEAAIADGMERERDTYALRLAERLGTKVTLA